jgi:hypothetical protein
MFLADVNKLGVLVVPHPDGDINRLILLLLAADLNELALPL